MNDEVMLSRLSLLKGIENAGKMGLKMRDGQLIPLADFFFRGDDIDSDMQKISRRDC